MKKKPFWKVNRGHFSVHFLLSLPPADELITEQSKDCRLKSSPGRSGLRYSAKQLKTRVDFCKKKSSFDRIYNRTMNWLCPVILKMAGVQEFQKFMGSDAQLKANGNCVNQVNLFALDPERPVSFNQRPNRVALVVVSWFYSFQIDFYRQVLNTLDASKSLC